MNAQKINDRDMTWAEQIRNDNQSAFTSLFGVYYIPLCEYAYRYVRQTELMEDIVQDVFVRIWEKRKQWHPRIAVRAYLYRSVHNQVVSGFRKKRFEIAFEENLSNKLSSLEKSPLDEICNNEVGEAIKRAIALLPERRREILVLRLLQGMSYKEISQVLCISVNTVDTQLRRALQHLRKHLQSVVNATEMV